MTETTQKKMFGVALDPSDDPWSLQLKYQWMMTDKARLEGLSLCLDPYDALVTHLSETIQSKGIVPAGKFPIPTWLQPKPDESDMLQVTPDNLAAFFDSGELSQITKKLQRYVESHILPAVPIMIGIDHSSTAGVLKALGRVYGRETICVLVFDQHFDAIPVSTRIKAALQKESDFSSGIPQQGLKDNFCCGDFWSFLIEEGVVCPQNLIFIGVGDYPTPAMNNRSNGFVDTYRKYIDLGCQFYPRHLFDGRANDALFRFLNERIKVPNVYVSLDLDVGSYDCTHAARYMDLPGIGRQDILDVASFIRKGCEQDKYRLIGADIMEFNMHFLGIELQDVKEENTLKLVTDFLNRLI